jgi:hypothetical protein
VQLLKCLLLMLLLLLLSLLLWRRPALEHLLRERAFRR